jgi:hypothetical protein
MMYDNVKTGNEECIYHPPRVTCNTIFHIMYGLGVFDRVVSVTSLTLTDEHKTSDEIASVVVTYSVQHHHMHVEEVRTQLFAYTYLFQMMIETQVEGNVE